MDSSKALHTAARRYCMERYAYWTRLYGERNWSSSDSPEALAAFPRYQVANALLAEVERIHPETLPDWEATKAMLLHAGTHAEDLFTSNPLGPIAEAAKVHERQAFCAYVRGLTPPKLADVEPLPYRRVLSDSESAGLRSRLRTRWDIEGSYWYPLDKRPQLDVEAFDAPAFYRRFPPKIMQGLLAVRGVDRVWELREIAESPEYEEDLALFKPYYNFSEGYWSSGHLDWIVYASHESSVTVGGWLLASIRDLWSEWDKEIWSPWDSQG